MSWVVVVKGNSSDGYTFSLRDICMEHNYETIHCNNFPSINSIIEHLLDQLKALKKPIVLAKRDDWIDVTERYID